MQFLDGGLYHFYNRGNNQKPTFFEPRNYLYFLNKVRQEITPYADVLAYCLMPNHFHFLLCPKNGSDQERHPLIRKLANLMSSYTRAINKEQGKSGSLFQQNAKARRLDDVSAYGLRCFYYIHRNPMDAKLETELGEWPYSSLPDYLGLRNGTLPNQKLALEFLDIPKDVSRLISELLHYRSADNSDFFEWD